MNLLLVLSALLLSIADRIAADDDQPVSYRLNEHQRPQSYMLDLEFRKDVFEGASVDYTGSLTIHFLVARSIQSIQFHAPVTIKSKEFIDNGTYTVDVESESFDPVTHIYTITAKKNLNYTHNYTLNLEFSSTVHTAEMRGVYRGSYVDEKGTAQYFVATHFQPTYARFGFPCFDEPMMKATFSISITYPKGLAALSNAAQVGSIEDIE